MKKENDPNDHIKSIHDEVNFIVGENSLKGEEQHKDHIETVHEGPDFITTEAWGVSLPPRCKRCLNCQTCKFENQHLTFY